MILKSKMCSYRDLDPFVIGTEFTYEALYGACTGNGWNEPRYRLELYRDENDGNLRMRVMKGNVLLVPAAHLSSAVAVLLEEK